MVIFFVSRWDEIFGRLKGLEILGVIFYRFGFEILGVILSIRIWESIFGYVIFGNVIFGYVIFGYVIFSGGNVLLIFIKYIVL